MNSNEQVAWLAQTVQFRTLGNTEQNAPATESISEIQKRQWVGLTDDDMDCLFPHGSSVWVQETVKIVEAKLKEKNA